jgi:hypothetical protein
MFGDSPATNAVYIWFWPILCKSMAYFLQIPFHSLVRLTSCSSHMNVCVSVIASLSLSMSGGGGVSISEYRYSSLKCFWLWGNTAFHVFIFEVCIHLWSMYSSCSMYWCMFHVFIHEVCIHLWNAWLWGNAAHQTHNHLNRPHQLRQKPSMNGVVFQYRSIQYRYRAWLRTGYQTDF